MNDIEMNLLFKIHQLTWDAMKVIIKKACFAFTLVL